MLVGVSDRLADRQVSSFSERAEVARAGLARSIPEIECGDAVGGAIAVAHSLHWVCVLDELLSSDRAEYRGQRGGDQAGCLLPALRLARNAVAHGALVAVYQTRGLVAPLIAPLRAREMRWLPLAAVLEFLDQKQPADSLQLYEKRVAGTPVEGMMVAVSDWFERYLDHRR